MNNIVLLSVILFYFLVLFVIAHFTGKGGNNESYFIGNRNSKWWLVAFGMIGTSISGMTFISVPGTVGASGFDYFQLVVGYFIGYIIVSQVLLPHYYRLQLTSIYTYLQQRFGESAYKTGALFFILSRTMGATLRLYLVIKILEKYLLEGLGIPFEVTALVILGLILLYTFRGGVKTIVWTDTLQTLCMLGSLLICVFYITNHLHLNGGVGALTKLYENGYLKIWHWENPLAGNYFLKQIIGGMFITIAMTGLDQEMMQKNISVKTLKDSQKNMIVMSLLQMGVVFMFLVLGGLLFLFFANEGGEFVHLIKNGSPVTRYMFHNIEVKSDDIFPTLALHFMPGAIGMVFLVGLISALFPSADGALTALTSSYCIDILGIMRHKNQTEEQQKRTRLTVHYCFTIVFLIFVFLYRDIDDGSLIQLLLTVAGYTYGPLLALFALGIFTKRSPYPTAIPIIAIFAPILCYILKQNDKAWLNGYTIGNELLVINGLITFVLLFAFSKAKTDALKA
ncbi:MAG: sodium:solute symporter [Chitinophagia bacterium]|nr:sodium:solute symporter [Chitinophagia bacterium]